MKIQLLKEIYSYIGQAKDVHSKKEGIRLLVELRTLIKIEETEQIVKLEEKIHNL